MIEETVTRQFPVEGMDCPDCAHHVEEAVLNLDGVREAQVLLAAERLDVVYDPALVDVETMAQTVARTGYTLKTESDPGDAAQDLTELPGRLTAVFAAVVAVVILVEMVGERFGLLEAAMEVVPPWLALVAILLGGYPIFLNVARALLRGKILSHTLMTLGIIGALSIGEYTAAAVIVFFMRVADYLEGFTTNRSRQAIRALMSLAPETAHLLRGDDEVEVHANSLAPGDRVVVRPGETVPADGAVETGSAALDQSPITGESMPVEKAPGASVFAGTIVYGGALTVRVTRAGADTTLSRIIRLVEEAEARKAPVQRIADRFAAWYLPVVAGAAALTYLIGRDVTAAMAVVLVACACAITLATPTAVIASVGRAARHGVLIKGGRTLELLARVDTVVMDKTGTLTFGRPEVTGVLAVEDRTEEDVLQLAAAAERYSEHPVAAAVRAAASKRGIHPAVPDSFEALPGMGVRARWDGRQITVGSRQLLTENNVIISAEAEEQAAAWERAGKTAFLVADDTHLAGLLAVADAPRPEVPDVIDHLRKLGIKHFLLLSGDNERTTNAIATHLGVAYRAQLLPEDKIEVVRELRAAGHTVMMVGDGVNDAPALAEADVGVAMGVAGTDAALEAADVALMRDDWRSVPAALLIGRRAFRVIQQNLTLGIVYNVVGISLAAVGLLAPVAAAAGQSIPDLLIMLNSARLLRD